MLTSIHWYSAEIFLIIGMGILVVWIGIRPEGFGQTTMTKYTQRITMYILMLGGILISQILTLTDELGTVLQHNPMSNTAVLVICITGGLITYLIKGEGVEKSLELGVLILFGCLGMIFVLMAKDLLMLYMGIEMQSLTLYVLATIKRNGEYSTEAGLKYFILGAVSSGLFLLGCVYIYIMTGTTSYSILTELSLSNSGLESLIGGVLIIIALLWKIGAAPFHMWVPDVYEGTPSTITAFFAIVPKISIFFAMLTLIVGPFLGLFINIQSLLLLSALLSLLIGSFGALNQTKFKRILAFSAISHTGFLLAGLATGSLDGFIASFVYIILYIIMSFATFGSLVLLMPNSSLSVYQLIALRRRNPILAICLALVLLSLAGVPPLAGFLSKLLILLSTLNSSFFLFSFMAVFASIISAFFYLRLVKFMFFHDSPWKSLADFSSNFIPSPSLSTSLLLGSSSFFTLTALFFPLPFLLFTSDALLASLT